ncbi:MAG: hypothetical protein ISR65_20520 [Bacteriovoracaceae bacterium]|nr:hypothetical protein [Bacteriovoracaceae bacterium]
MKKIISLIAAVFSIVGISKPASANNLLDKLHLPSSDQELEILLEKSGVSLKDLKVVEDKRLEEMTSEELKKIIIIKDLSSYRDTDTCRCAR